MKKFLSNVKGAIDAALIIAIIALILGLSSTGFLAYMFLPKFLN